MASPAVRTIALLSAVPSSKKNSKAQLDISVTCASALSRAPPTRVQIDANVAPHTKTGDWGQAHAGHCTRPNPGSQKIMRSCDMTCCGCADPALSFFDTRRETKNAMRK